MNLIDSMTEREAKSLLNDIFNVFSIGGYARTRARILTNINNSKRRSDCLGRIENYLSSTEIDEDGQAVEESLLNWGEQPDEYLKTFIVALDVKSLGVMK